MEPIDGSTILNKTFFLLLNKRYVLNVTQIKIKFLMLVNSKL